MTLCTWEVWFARTMLLKNTFNTNLQKPAAPNQDSLMSGRPTPTALKQRSAYITPWPDQGVI